MGLAAAVMVSAAAGVMAPVVGVIDVIVAGVAVMVAVVGGSRVAATRVRGFGRLDG